MRSVQLIIMIGVTMVTGCSLRPNILDNLPLPSAISIQVPTDTPKPTSTLLPTETPIQTPTLIPTPTAIPTPLGGGSGEFLFFNNTGILRYRQRDLKGGYLEAERIIPADRFPDEFLQESQDVGRTSYFSPDGKKAAIILGYDKMSTYHKILVINLETGEMEVIIPGINIEPSMLGWAFDSNSFYVAYMEVIAEDTVFTGREGDPIWQISVSPSDFGSATFVRKSLSFSPLSSETYYSYNHIDGFVFKDTTSERAQPVECDLCGGDLVYRDIRISPKGNFLFLNGIDNELDKDSLLIVDSEFSKVFYREVFTDTVDDHGNQVSSLDWAGAIWAPDESKIFLDIQEQDRTGRQMIFDLIDGQITEISKYSYIVDPQTQDSTLQGKRYSFCGWTPDGQGLIHQLPYFIYDILTRTSTELPIQGSYYWMGCPHFVPPV